MKFKNFVIWITGLSGVGKTTIGKSVYEKLKKTGYNIVFLDGDSFRNILGNTYGYSKEERIKVANIISNFCIYLNKQNLNVICCTISLLKEIHKKNRANIKNYVEVFVQCDMDELIKRDKKKIYSGFQKKKTKNIVGVDMKCDFPKNPEIILNNTSRKNFNTNVNILIDFLNDRMKKI